MIPIYALYHDQVSELDFDLEAEMNSLLLPQVQLLYSDMVRALKVD